MNWKSNVVLILSTIAFSVQSSIGQPRRIYVDENGYPDGCDLAAEISEDRDENGVPDECEEVQRPSQLQSMSMSGEGASSANDGLEASEDDPEAWAEFYQWCIEQNWGPDSQYSLLEQLERFSAKRHELGL